MDNIKTARETFFMCRPDHFGVTYIINPWMEGNVGRASAAEATAQWEAFHGALTRLADVTLIDPRPELPDMVFTANAGLVLEREVVLSRFAHPQRQREEPLFQSWFEERGYNVHLVPEPLHFEGAGDALLDRNGWRLWAAYGNRTSLETHPFLSSTLDLEVIGLRLTDTRFYHLDTCFLPLEDGYLIYYPHALDTASNRRIERLVPPEKRIALSHEDALAFTANAVNVGRTVILNRCSPALRQLLGSFGFEVVQTPLSEFMKAGGSAKCLTLRLTETGAPQREARCGVAGRTVQAQGQLIDSDMISRICDTIIIGGGSFQISEIHLGQKREEDSTALIDVAAPDHAALDRLVQKIIRLGARLPSAEAADAKLEPVTHDGVAPENFYSTTIYSTQVRVRDEWLDVENQRMDSVIVVSDGSARCALLRNLKKGDRVVTGGEGIRTARFVSQSEYRQEFGFMESNISSERRVELTIDRIAWEISRIRARGGRLVVVAGPVVAHTGGAPHLAWMAHKGYVGALLGGNAIAAHDIEQAMFGTSLGVDLKTGNPVEGGHRNHIAAINRIRRAGSIAAAVKNEELTSGLFYELVKSDIPFSLAGSIRDDGPLPETQMDLIEAQEDYARLIKGADMILMLSSMLHSIGAGNMTPASVKLVCVDINPAVVTKLSDRGSLESIGVVTDVGLFLALLVSKITSIDEH